MIDNGQDRPSAARRSSARNAAAYWFFDSLMVTHNDGSDGGPVIIEATVAPGGGAPLHVHSDLDDTFYLVSGQLAMRCGDDAFVVEPGDYVALPRGVPHTFRVTGDQPAVMLQIHADDSFLRFIQAIGLPAPALTLPLDQHLDLDLAFAAAAETGQPVVGPPMGADEAAALVANAR